MEKIYNKVFNCFIFSNLKSIKEFKKDFMFVIKFPKTKIYFQGVKNSFVEVARQVLAVKV